MSELNTSLNYRVMSVAGVAYDLGDSSPIVELVENEEPFRRLQIPVALPDALNIRNALAGVEAARPTSSELLSAVLERLNASIIDVRVVKFEDGIYYSELDVQAPSGRETFDCRTSDGIALSLRQRVTAPILCSESLFD